jgi:GMP synthase-like glutamine amidotransferase
MGEPTMRARFPLRKGRATTPRGVSTSMRVHVFQHVSFEGLGSMGPWLESRGARVTHTRFFEDPTLPPVGDLDWLIVMGGPMSANDDERLPWLVSERALIAEAVGRGKTVLGVCLGAQLIAKALGARVFPNAEPEIGWFRVERGAGDPAADEPLDLPIEAFHWHGETFDLPRGATHVAMSAACSHQAFAVGRTVLGLQFHLEMTPQGARALAEACRHEIRPAPWIQTEAEILGDPGRFERVNEAMRGVLEWLARAGP